MLTAIPKPARRVDDNVPTEIEFDRLQAWGISCSIDIHHCDPETIRNRNHHTIFVLQLRGLIGMPHTSEADHSPAVSNQAEGFSTVLAIAQSLIAVHAAQQSNAVYIDIRMDSYFDPSLIAHYALDFFRGSDYNLTVAMRK